jgi:hypothetical protein
VLFLFPKYGLAGALYATCAGLVIPFLTACFLGYASDLHISRSVFTVLQFLVVATTESFFSIALLESLVLP